MERRFVLFVVLSILILIGNLWLQTVLHPPQKVPPGQKANEQGENQVAAGKAQGAEGDAAQADQAAAKPPAAEPAKAAAPGAAEAPEARPQWFTLGSADPDEKNPYRLLLTLTNHGAAVERIETSSPRFRDFEDRSGYLGHLAAADVPQGVMVNVVGPGTPAAAAGLQPGDIITAVEGQSIADAAALEDALKHTHPEQQIDVTISRASRPQTVSATLAWRPSEIVQPETGMSEKAAKSLGLVSPDSHDPFSFLLTLWQVDDQKLADSAAIDAELQGVRLRSAYWTGKQVDADTVEFSRPLASLGLEVLKRYRLAKTSDENPAYQFTLEVELRNVGAAARKVAYQLDGPTGLPTEGWWYSTRISREWGGVGVRDVTLMLQGKEPTLITPMQVAAGNLNPPYRSEDPGELLAYAGVDAQYFACALLPEPFQERPPWLAQIKAILVGALPQDQRFRSLGDVTCRLVSITQSLEPNGPPLKHLYTVFAGPKQPHLLAQYGDPQNNLGELIYYGWPIWAGVARLMTQLLHFFYSIVGNYGIAIVMLTILVRACMFPISRRQAMMAQKMQELKPEMDRINEKYKGKAEEKTRAMQELWRKHNYNPMSGCLPLFLQLPVFMGLYRALMIDIELRQAPLLGSGIRWCSNLAAPDMLWNWTGTMPTFLTAYRGFLSLGPYLNILPLFTVGLMIWQQKMFMPPATDEQSAMQQKMMKYMMLFMAFVFFTVPSGLCIYFIASSLWGIAEKKFLPKTLSTKPASDKPGFWAKLAAAAAPTGDSNGSAADAKRERKKQRRGR